MQLTTQMKAEIETIGVRVHHIITEVWTPLESDMARRGKILPEYEKICHEVIEELNPYKVRLENILCETDKKEQAHLR